VLVKLDLFNQNVVVGFSLHKSPFFPPSSPKYTFLMVLSRRPLDKRFGLQKPLWEISGPREIDFSVGYSQAAAWVVKGKIASPNPTIFQPNNDFHLVLYSEGKYQEHDFRKKVVS
jgi:hypothetical protein